MHKWRIEFMIIKSTSRISGIQFSACSKTENSLLHSSLLSSFLNCEEIYSHYFNIPDNFCNLMQQFLIM